jgi:hypothetical protein
MGTGMLFIDGGAFNELYGLCGLFGRFWLLQFGLWFWKGMKVGFLPGVHFAANFLWAMALWVALSLMA